MSSPRGTSLINGTREDTAMDLWPFAVVGLLAGVLIAWRPQIGIVIASGLFALMTAFFD